MVDVTYYCPHCGAVATLERDAYLADKSVTPFPLQGWTYVSPSDSYEADDADGVKSSAVGVTSSGRTHPTPTGRTNPAVASRST